MNGSPLFIVPGKIDIPFFRTPFIRRKAPYKDIEKYKKKLQSEFMHRVLSLVNNILQLN